SGQVVGALVIGCGGCSVIAGVALDHDAGRADQSDHRLGRVADCYGADDLDGSVAAGIHSIVGHVINSRHIHIDGVPAHGRSGQGGVAGVADAGALLSVSAGVAFQSHAG